MIATSPQRPKTKNRNSVTISFSSTLYLWPILDLLLADVPTSWEAELRLGLQEALVNAAKHGNKLDPSKQVLVRSSVINNQYCWEITDQGSGFAPPASCQIKTEAYTDCPLPCDEQECGRGLFILYQVFDRVEWNAQGTELKLLKEVKHRYDLPLQ